MFVVLSLYLLPYHLVFNSSHDQTYGIYYNQANGKIIINSTSERNRYYSQYHQIISDDIILPAKYVDIISKTLCLVRVVRNGYTGTGNPSL